jgi:hypothetical protein
MKAAQMITNRNIDHPTIIFFSSPVQILAITLAAYPMDSVANAGLNSHMMATSCGVSIYVTIPLSVYTVQCL